MLERNRNLFPTVKLLYTDLHAPVRKKAILVQFKWSSRILSLRMKIKSRLLG